MKTNINVTIDSSLVEEAHFRNLNISGICNAALQEAVGTKELTPEDKAAAGMVKQAEVKEKLEREGNLEKLQAKYFKLDADLREILKEKGPAGMNVYVKTRKKFPAASAFIQTPEAIEAQIKRIEYALPLIKKVSLKLPSKKDVKTNASKSAIKSKKT